MRAVQKMKDLGPALEILQTFLSSYRSTPYSSSSGGRSPAENYIGTQLRTRISLLKPSDEPYKFHDKKMEAQFNRRMAHRSKTKIFKKMTWFGKKISAKVIEDGHQQKFFSAEEAGPSMWHLTDMFG